MRQVSPTETNPGETRKIATKATFIAAVQRKNCHGLGGCSATMHALRFYRGYGLSVDVAWTKSIPCLMAVGMTFRG